MKKNLLKLLVLVMTLLCAVSMWACEKELTVTFSANGGEFENGKSKISVTVKENALLDIPEEPVRDDYFFAGWSREENDEDIWDFESDKVKSAITLYAVWSDVPVEEIPGYGDSEGGPDASVGDEIPSISGKNPATLYAAFVKAMDNLTDYTAEICIKEAESDSSNSTEQVMLFEVDEKKHHVKSFASDHSVDPSVDYSVDYWYIDGFYYEQYSDGSKSKSEMEYDNFAKTYSIQSIYNYYGIGSLLMSVPADWFGDVDFVKLDSGDFGVSFETNGKTVSETFSNFNISDSAAVSYEIVFGTTGTIKKISVNISAIENDITKTVSRSIEFSKIGGTAVKAPEGSESWPFETPDTPDEEVKPDYPSENPIDPPTDDPINPPTDDPINPPTDNPIEPPEEKPDDKPTTSGKYDYIITWDKTDIKMELTKNSSHGELSSGCERYYAGTKVDAFAPIDEQVRVRNSAAAEAANVIYRPSYVAEGDGTGWGANINRIAHDAASGRTDAPDIYCNFAYDMTCAQLRGCFANLKDTSWENGNYFRFNDPDYNPISDDYFDAEAGEGYFYEYMQSLSLSRDKMYILASNYTIDVIRAMTVVPVNIAMLESIFPEDSWTGDMNSLNDFYDLVWRDADKVAINQKYETGFTYDVLAHYAQKIYMDCNRGNKLGNTVGFIADRSSGLASSAFLYSSGISIINRTPEADAVNYTYYYPEHNIALNEFAEAVTALFRNNAEKGVITVTRSEAEAYDPNVKGELELIRRKFACNEVLFGGVVMVGQLEDDVYQAMREGGRDGFGILPVPVYQSGQDYLTLVHNLARVVAIGKGSSVKSQCSAYLDYVSRDSATILETYYTQVLADATGGIAALQNKEMLTYIRNHVRDCFQKTYEDAIAYKYAIVVGSEAAKYSEWHEIYGNKNGFIYPSFATDYAEKAPVKEEHLNEVVADWRANT